MMGTTSYVDSEGRLVFTPAKPLSSHTRHRVYFYGVAFQLRSVDIPVPVRKQKKQDKLTAESTAMHKAGAYIASGPGVAVTAAAASTSESDPRPRSNSNSDRRAGADSVGDSDSDSDIEEAPRARRSSGDEPSDGASSPSTASAPVPSGDDREPAQVSSGRAGAPSVGAASSSPSSVHSTHSGHRESARVSAVGAGSDGGGVDHEGVEATPATTGKERSTRKPKKVIATTGVVYLEQLVASTLQLGDEAMDFVTGCQGCHCRAVVRLSIPARCSCNCCW